jgi:uncharacterized protein (DUF2147 family)
MRRALALAAVALLGLAAAARAEDGDAIVGLWQTEPSTGGLAHVEITKAGTIYSGRIVWVERPTYPPDDEQGMAGQTRVDRNNPDPALRKAPIIGLVIVRDFVYAGEKQWKDGFIYDPDNGKTYRCKARLEGNTLKLRGYIGISLLGRNALWTRVQQPPATPSPAR